MARTDPTSVTSALRSALARAMAQRDRTSVAVYRTALSAIDNAAAVPLGNEQRAGAIEAAAVGVGRTEVGRRLLTPDDEVHILEQEIRERRAAADAVAVTRPDTARKLRNEAALLQTLLDGLASDD